LLTALDPIQQSRGILSDRLASGTTSKVTLDENILRCLRHQLFIINMFLARRSVAPARQVLRRQQPRRFDSHAAHHDHHNDHHAPVNEAYGVGHTSFDVVETNWKTNVPVPSGSTS
jgi:hypothetical protein